MGLEALLNASRAVATVSGRSLRRLKKREAGNEGGCPCQRLHRLPRPQRVETSQEAAVMMSFWRMRCGCPWSAVRAGRLREAQPPRCCWPVCPALWVRLSSRQRTGSLPLRAGVLGHSPDRVRRAARYRKVAWGGDKALVETAVCRAGRQPLRLRVCSVWGLALAAASLWGPLLKPRT